MLTLKVIQVFPFFPKSQTRFLQEYLEPGSNQVNHEIQLRVEQYFIRRGFYFKYLRDSQNKIREIKINWKEVLND